MSNLGKGKEGFPFVCRDERVSLPKRKTSLVFSLGIAVNTAMTVTNVEHYWRNLSIRNFLAVTCFCVTAFFSVKNHKKPLQENKIL